MKGYITLLLSALTAVLCCGSCSSNSRSESTSEAATSAVTTEAATDNVTTEQTIEATTAKAAEDVSFTKADLAALDPSVLCVDYEKRSGEYHHMYYDPISDTDVHEDITFFIDEPAQTGYQSYTTDNGSGDEIKYLSSVYSISIKDGKYRITDRYIELENDGCAHIKFFGDPFYYGVPSSAVADDDNYEITGESERNGRRVACISGSYTFRDEDVPRLRYYNKEIDLDTGICLFYECYDEDGRTVLREEYTDLRFGDEAVPPRSRQEMKEYIVSSGLASEEGYSDKTFDLSVLDSDTGLMPEAWESVLSPDQWEVVKECMNTKAEN